MAKKNRSVSGGNEPGRSMINIELAPEAQRAVDDACDKWGMKKRELVARALKWFAGQDDEIQTLVLGLIPPSVAPMVARKLLEDMAGVNSLVGHVDEKSPRRR